MGDLDDLLRAVRNSHNLVVMLTKGVFSRPWCILEIVVAMQCNCHVVPILIKKPGSEFEFPDESFYQELVEGRVLVDEACALVESYGFTILQVAKAIRRVL